MKIKKATAVLTALLTIGSVSAVNASDFTVNLNGESTKFVNSPFLMEDYIMMPVRETAEKYSYKVIWNEEDGSIELLKVDSTCTLKADSDEVTINGNTLKLPKPITVVDGRSYAPIALFKNLEGDTNINWDYDNSILSMTSYAIRSKEGLFAPPKIAETAVTSLLSGDGTFEDGTTQGWVKRGSTTTVSATNKVAHKGKYSMVASSTDTTKALSFCLDTKSVLETNGPGKYNLSFWAKTNKNTLSCKIVVAKINNTDEFASNVNIDSEWKKYSIDVDISWAKLDSALAIFHFAENGGYAMSDELYIDDIILTKK